MKETALWFFLIPRKCFWGCQREVYFPERI